MVNDVRGLFLKINQVDLPYQVFDNLGDVEAVDETQVDVLAPLPVIPRHVEPDDEPGEVAPEHEPERPHGARKVIANIRQRVFQGFAIPNADGKVAAPEPMVEAKAFPAAAPVPVASQSAGPEPRAPIPLFPPKPAPARTGSGLLRRYAPAPTTTTAASASTGRGTSLKSLFDRLGSKD